MKTAQKLYLPSGKDKFLCRTCYGIRYLSHHKDRLGQIGGMGRKLAMLRGAFHKGYRWGKKLRARYVQIVSELEQSLNFIETLLGSFKRNRLFLKLTKAE